MEVHLVHSCLGEVHLVRIVDYNSSCSFLGDFEDNNDLVEENFDLDFGNLACWY